MGQPQSQPKPPVIRPSSPHHTPHLCRRSVGKRRCLQSLLRLPTQRRMPMAPPPPPEPEAEVEAVAVAGASQGQAPEPVMTPNQDAQDRAPLLGFRPTYKSWTIALLPILSR